MAKVMDGFYCTASVATKEKCSGYCKGCGYSRYDAYGTHRNSDSSSASSARPEPIYVPSHRRCFISDEDLKSGAVVLY